MVGSNYKKADNVELLIDLLDGCLTEEGYKVKRFSDTDRHSTTAYDSIVIKDYRTNQIITLTVDNSGNDYLKYLFEKES